MLLQVHELLLLFCHVSVCVIVYAVYAIAYLSRCACCAYKVETNETKSRMSKVHDIPADKFDEQFHKPDTMFDDADEVSRRSISSAFHKTGANSVFFI